MRGLKPASRLLSRGQFERLIEGEWEDFRGLSGKHYRKNGPFRTTVTDKGMKEISDGPTTLRAKTWYELAKQLELI